MKKKKTLYECSQARVKGERIYCNNGYLLSPQLGDGTLHIRHLAEGKQLAPKVCQQCGDFDSMGPPIPEEEKGWIKTGEVEKHDTNHRQVLREAVA